MIGDAGADDSSADENDVRGMHGGDIVNRMMSAGM